MPADEKILKDFDTYTKRMEDQKEWLNKLYYDPEFSTLFNRPMLSMLLTGCDFFIENFAEMKRKYELRKIGK